LYFNKRRIPVNIHRGFEALTAVVMKSSVFWDIMPLRLLKDSRHFVGTYHLHIQGSRVSQARNQHEAGSKQSLLGLLINPEDDGDMFLRIVG
jgi:hypothetical protein